MIRAIPSAVVMYGLFASGLSRPRSPLGGGGCSSSILRWMNCFSFVASDFDSA
jgi:hypothetical protein